MEALCSSLVVRMKTEMIDSSCKSHITVSKGLFSCNASNHTERSWHPQVHQPLNPSLNYAYEMTDFPGNFSKQPTVVTLICQEPNKLVYVCVSAYNCELCICACSFQCVYLCVTGCVSCTHINQRADASISGDGEHILASHTCGSMSKFTLH